MFYTIFEHFKQLHNFLYIFLTFTHFNDFKGLINFFLSNIGQPLIVRLGLHAKMVFAKTKKLINADLIAIVHPRANAFKDGDNSINNL